MRHRCAHYRTLLWNAAQTVAAAASNFLDTLSTMDTAYMGQPFVQGPTKSTTDLQTMDYAYCGKPFVRYRK